MQGIDIRQTDNKISRMYSVASSEKRCRQWQQCRHVKQKTYIGCMYVVAHGKVCLPEILDCMHACSFGSRLSVLRAYGTTELERCLVGAEQPCSSWQKMSHGHLVGSLMGSKTYMLRWRSRARAVKASSTRQKQPTM